MQLAEAACQDSPILTLQILCPLIFAEKEYYTLNIFKKLFFTKKTDTTQHQSQWEKCVYCGAQTTVDVSAPIESRPNFISGCGQLCPECYAKLCSNSELDCEDSRLVSAVLNKAEEQ